MSACLVILYGQWKGDVCLFIQKHLELLRYNTPPPPSSPLEVFYLFRVSG